MYKADKQQGVIVQHRELYNYLAIILMKYNL